jgi:hypothetical protein
MHCAKNVHFPKDKIYKHHGICILAPIYSTEMRREKERTKGHKLGTSN